MIPYIVLYLGLTAIVFVFAYWAYDNDELNRRKIFSCEEEISVLKQNTSQTINKINEIIYGVRNDLQSVKNLFEPNQAIESMRNWSKEMCSLKEEIELCQNHCAKLRDDQMLLQSQLSNKRPIISLTKGAIQIELIPGSKKAGEHKQMYTGKRAAAHSAAEDAPSRYEPKKNLGKKKKVSSK